MGCVRIGGQSTRPGRGPYRRCRKTCHPGTGPAAGRTRRVPNCKTGLHGRSHAARVHSCLRFPFGFRFRFCGRSGTRADIRPGRCGGVRCGPVTGAGFRFRLRFGAGRGRGGRRLRRAHRRGRTGGAEDPVRRLPVHRLGGEPAPVRFGGGAGASEVREPAAHRLLQNTWRVRADRGPVAAGAGGRCGRRQRRQPRAGRRAGGLLLGVRSTVFMPVGAPLPKVAATREYGADGAAAGPCRG